MIRFSSRRTAGARALRLALVQLGVVALLLAGTQLVLYRGNTEASLWVLALLPALAVVYLAAGAVAWWRRPSNGLGPLLCAGGVGWLAAGQVNTDVAPLVGVGLVTAVLPLAVVVHALHAFPSGRLTGRASRVVVAAGYLTALVLHAPRYLFDPLSPLAVADRPDLLAAQFVADAVAGGAVMIATAVILGGRLRAATPAQRRVLAPLYGYSMVAVLLVTAAYGVLEPLGLDPVARFTIQCLLLAGIPVAFALGILRGGFARTAEIQELGTWLGADVHGRVGLTEALATTLGDPSLRLAYRSGDGYMDAAGAPVDLPTNGPDRAVAPIDLAGRPVGAILYDPVLAGDADHVAAAGRVVAIALDRERLTAELRAGREALRVSRQRIVEAADGERRRIAQDLHDGLQARLVALAMRAGWIADGPTADPTVREDAAEVRSGLDTAITELRRLVHGLMPAILIERGLYAAVEDLAEQMPVPVRVELHGSAADLPGPVVSAAYLVVAEALTNAVKHSGSAALAVRLDRTVDRLRIEVRDDGCGGATPSGGAGLVGIADRVDVAGGSLEIDSPVGRGTTIRVELPCAS